MKKQSIILLLALNLVSFFTHAQGRNSNSTNQKITGSERSGIIKTKPGDINKQAAGNGNNKIMGVGSLGTKIGKTYYDEQTAGSSGSRIIRYADGTISAVWNEVCNSNTYALGHPTKGIGYNYFNFTSWSHGQTVPPPGGVFEGTCNEPASTNGPDFGIASKRAGSPEIVSTPNYQELIFTSSTTGINLTSRPVKGTGGMASWSTTADLPFTQNILGAGNYGGWPRAASDGLNVHIIYSVNKSSAQGLEPAINGVTQPFVHSRSVDGGLTWDKQNTFLPDLDGVVAGNNATYTNDNYRSIGRDNYAIAARGNVVAVVAGSHGDPWTLWKSTNNGTTWTRRVIKYVSSADTVNLTGSNPDTVVYTNDKAHSLIIDGNGQVHVFAGMILCGIDVKTRPAAAGGGSYFRSQGSIYPSDDYPNYGLLYWNGGMPATINSIFDLKIAGVEDSKPVTDTMNWVATGAGPPAKRFPYHGIGIVSMPSAAIDANNNIFVVYSGVVEGTSTNLKITGQPYRDLYLMKRFAVNGSWANPINLARSLDAGGAFGVSTAENFEESVFPSIAKAVGPDNVLHIVFQQDTEPGTTLGNDVDAEEENNIMYYRHEPYIYNGVTKPGENSLQNLSAYPNPTNGKINFTLLLTQPTEVSLSIKNLLGQEVAAIEKSKLKAGENQLNTDVSHLARGVYLFTVTSESFVVTQKIVKQ